MVKVIIGLTTMMGCTFAIKINLIPTSPLKHGVSNMEGFNNENPLDLHYYILCLFAKCQTKNLKGL
jgi:hypothetical protein